MSPPELSHTPAGGLTAQAELLCTPFVFHIHLRQITNTQLSFSVFYQLSETSFKTNLTLLLPHSPPSLLLSPHSPLLFAQSAVPNLLLLLSVAKPTFKFFSSFFSPLFCLFNLNSAPALVQRYNSFVMLAVTVLTAL